jgi:hypothetical protein
MQFKIGNYLYCKKEFTHYESRKPILFPNQKYRIQNIVPVTSIGQIITIMCEFGLIQSFCALPTSGHHDIPTYFMIGSEDRNRKLEDILK